MHQKFLLHSMNKILLFLFCISIIKPVLGQKITDTFIQSSAYISYIKKQDTILVRTSGSGFLIYFLDDTTANRERVFLITNKHVLPKSNESKTITVKVPYKINNDFTFKEFSVEIYNRDNNLNSCVKLHKNKNTDIAAIDLSFILNSKN